MKKKNFYAWALCLLLAGTNAGCAIFLLGAGAAGGYAISKDEIEGMTDVAYNKVWVALKDDLQARGALTLEDRAHGRIEAVVDASTVEAQVDQVTPKTVRVRVKARKTKGLFPDIKLAQDIYDQVMKRVD
jgi:hypothetical protein